MPAFANPNALSKFKFVDPDGNENTVWYRQKQDLEIDAAIERELLEMRVNANDMTEDSANMRIHFGVGAQRMAVLKYNIRKWDGPWFYVYEYDDDGEATLKKTRKGEPILTTCSPKNIGSLYGPDNEEWLAEIYQVISDSNQKTVAHPKEKPVPLKK